MTRLLQKLKLGMNRLSSAAEYCHSSLLDLKITTYRKGDLQKPVPALHARYCSSIPYPDSFGKLSPRRSVEFLKTRVAEMPQCPSNFPKKEFYTICKQQEYDRGLIHTEEWKYLDRIDLEKLSEMNMRFTQAHVLGFNSNKEGNMLHDLYTPSEKFPFSLSDLYCALSKAGHRVASCNLTVDTHWAGPAWMGLPSEHDPPTVHLHESFSLETVELVDTLQEFARYCGERALQRDCLRERSSAA